MKAKLRSKSLQDHLFDILHCVVQSWPLLAFAFAFTTFLVATHAYWERPPADWVAAFGVVAGGIGLVAFWAAPTISRRNRR